MYAENAENADVLYAELPCSNLILRICQKCGDDVTGAYLIRRYNHTIGLICDLKDINLGCTS
jgi:hypothetical protein